MPDPARRMARLLDGLPRIYTAQPDASAIGTVLRTMAAVLAQLDDDMRRVLHDRWLGLATGGADPGGESALERLGALLDVPRLQVAGTAADEGTEAFRARVGITARALIGGLATPPAILALALADLGLEPCPRMETRSPTTTADALWRVDATIAWGVKLGTRRTCPACRGGGDGVCPNRRKSLADAWISENPTAAEAHAESSLKLWQDFTVTSVSLESDRPVLRLSPLPGAGVLAYPALQNRDTGEIVLFADTLRPGETLVLQSAASAAEIQVFDSYDATPHHGWLAQYPAGRAIVQDGTPSGRDAAGRVFLIAGSRFDDLTSTFDASGFSELASALRMPFIQPGTQTWRLMSLPNPASRFDEPASSYADEIATEGTRFAQWDAGVSDLDAEQALMLFDRLVQAERDAANDPHAADRKPVAKLVLEWMVRPPASFRLRIPRNDAVDRARALGALDLLQADLAAARGAGIRAEIDFPEPAWRDEQNVSDRFAGAVGQIWRDRAANGEGALGLLAAQTARETHEVADRLLLWDGRFDATRLDGTALQ